MKVILIQILFWCLWPFLAKSALSLSSWPGWSPSSTFVELSEVHNVGDRGKSSDNVFLTDDVDVELFSSWIIVKEIWFWKRFPFDFVNHILTNVTPAKPNFEVFGSKQRLKRFERWRWRSRKICRSLGWHLSHLSPSAGGQTYCYVFLSMSQKKFESRSVYLVWIHFCLSIHNVCANKFGKKTIACTRMLTLCFFHKKAYGHELKWLCSSQAAWWESALLCRFDPRRQELLVIQQNLQEAQLKEGKWEVAVGQKGQSFPKKLFPLKKKNPDSSMWWICD